MDIMAVNARDEEQQYGNNHLGLGLSLSLGLGLGVATAAPVEVEPPTAAAAAAASYQRRAHHLPPRAAVVEVERPRSLRTTMDQQQQPAAARHGHEMPFLRGVDVNRAPAGDTRRGSCSEDDEEPGGASSSPNSTLSSSLSGKRAAPARSGGEVADHTPRAGGGSDDEDSGGGSRKKLRLSKDQAAVLEESFKEHNTLNPKQKAALAKQLNLKPRQVEVWFQNRRARTKLKQTEVDCEFLKRCCETLTEENRRLQREVAELRALKLVAPHHYARMPPPTTLTMCPSCERLASASASADQAGRAGPCWGPLPVFVDGPARRP
ncbi:Homeobox-leucine zipper protein HOX1 [Zea mays]|uniref:Homeobox-leucine zipper protein HOX1 n=1 Tax=Zea mays TaxID=4577 RepID=A0A317YEX0_MAIZE|nr:Homeobox-leucine zipper protein HOX1 [Zea mays]